VSVDDLGVALPFPVGVSGLIDPDDEPIIAILEACAADRRRLGLPSYTRDDLERLFRVLDAPAPDPDRRSNVVPFPGRPRRRR
jgi:hypothetical protein